MRVLWPGDDHFPSPAAWDDFVSSSPYGHLLQSWHWGEFKGHFGWRPSRLAIADDGQLVATAQLLLRRLPYRCLAYVPRGPVYDPENEQLGPVLLPALHQAARREGAIALKVEPPWLDGDEACACWSDNGFRASPQTVQPRRTIVIDLRPDEEAILGQMKSKWRYNVRLASRKGVTVRQGSGEDLATYYRLMQETSERDGFAIHVPEYYETAFRLFEPSGRVVLLLAEYQGEPLAGLMAFAFGSQAIFMYGASSDRERNRMPNHLLQWEAMRWAKGRGCEAYDLWGIPDVEPGSPSASLSGVERFKAGFGGEERRYAGAFDCVYSPLVYRAFNWLWSRRRARAQRAVSPKEAEA